MSWLSDLWNRNKGAITNAATTFVASGGNPLATGAALLLGGGGGGSSGGGAATPAATQTPTIPGGDTSEYAARLKGILGVTAPVTQTTGTIQGENGVTTTGTITKTNPAIARVSAPNVKMPEYAAPLEPTKLSGGFTAGQVTPIGQATVQKIQRVKDQGTMQPAMTQAVGQAKQVGNLAPQQLRSSQMQVGQQSAKVAVAPAQQASAYVPGQVQQAQGQVQGVQQLNTRAPTAGTRTVNNAARAANQQLNYQRDPAFNQQYVDRNTQVFNAANEQARTRDIRRALDLAAIRGQTNSGLTDQAVSDMNRDFDQRAAENQNTALNQATAWQREDTAANEAIRSQAISQAADVGGQQFSQGMQGAQFTNDATGRNNSQIMDEARLANEAATANNSADLARARLGLDATAQDNATALDRARFEREGIGADNESALKLAQFTREGLQADNANDMELAKLRAALTGQDNSANLDVSRAENARIAQDNADALGVGRLALDSQKANQDASQRQAELDFQAQESAAQRQMDAEKANIDTAFKTRELRNDELQADLQNEAMVREQANTLADRAAAWERQRQQEENAAGLQNYSLQAAAEQNYINNLLKSLGLASQDNANIGQIAADFAKTNQQAAQADRDAQAGLMSGVMDGISNWGSWKKSGLAKALGLG